MNLLAFDWLQNCDFWIHSSWLLEFHSVFWNFRPLKSGLMVSFFCRRLPWHAWSWRRPTVIPSGVIWQSTSWTVQPLASDQLILLSPSHKAKGLFKRSISAPIPKSGGRGLLKPCRKAWRKTAWQTSQKIKDPLRRQTPSPDIQSLPLHGFN